VNFKIFSSLAVSKDGKPAGLVYCFRFNS